ncbi:MAG: glycosyltransferase family 4 protein [Dehalococcoidia bacterium]|nr:glycosyltransferase family 4 protein [Dehalococcoidia bacterium]
MRICLLTYRGNPYSGGQGIYIYYLSREFRRMGHEVEVIASAPLPEVSEGVILHQLTSSSIYHPGSSFKKNLPKVRNPIDLYELCASRLGVFAEPWAFSFRAYAKLKELCTQRRFDIVHDNQGLGYGLLLMKRLKIPVIATIHHPLPIDSQADLEQANGFRQRWRIKRFYSFIRMQAFVARHLDRIITVSQSSARDTNLFFKVPADRLRVVYNGIDTDIFSMNEKASQASDGLIMVANTDDRKKGVLYLLQALQLLRKDGIKLTIVDDADRHSSYIEDVGPLPSYGFKLVRKLNLDGLVHFTGRLTREEMVKRYSAAKIAVVPSLYEGFGLPAAEAMACGVPVIATTGGALPEVVGDAGILVPPRNADALAAAIKQLLADKQAQQRMSEAGRKRVREKFSWEQAARKTLEVYQEVLSTR